MGTSSGVAVVSLCLMAMVAMSAIGAAEAQPLRKDFYDKSCQQIFSIVKAGIKKAVKTDKRMAASIVRLHFHDCFVNGCDGSVLLDDSPTIDGEKLAFGNVNSARGFDVIDSIKAALEKACPRTVSCADILTLASRDSAVEVGLTENFPVFFGRRDSRTASRLEANRRLPSPLSNYEQLKANFAFQGLNEVDLVALSGAHTFGRVRCGVVRLSLNDTNSNAEFRRNLAKACPANGNPLTLNNIDPKTPDQFDNAYYKNLQRGESTMRSDQVLQSTPGPNVALVRDFAQDQAKFFRQYAASSIKMANIKPLTGNQGEIRVNCGVPNGAPRFQAPAIAVE